MTHAQLAFHLMKDEIFRTQVLANPKAALELPEVSLSREEVESLSNLPWLTLLSTLEPQDSIFGPDGPGWWGCQFDHRFTLASLSSTS